MKLAGSLLWRGGISDALLMAPIAMAGVALPLGFVSQVDGYLKFLRPIELPAVYAWGWVVFWLLGLVLALATIGPVVGAARLLRQSPVELARRAGAWLALLIVVVSLMQGTKSWLEAYEGATLSWLTELKMEVGVAVAAGCAVWIWRYPEFPEGLRSISKLGMLAGLVPVVMAGFIALFMQQFPPVPATTGKSGGQAVKTPNIILLTIDTLAADHTSLLGYQRPTTPNLQALALQASVFERFYANSNHTTPSVTSIIHGKRPWSHRAIHQYAQIDVDRAGDNLVARLKKAGYHTIAVATNPAASPSLIRIDRWLDKVTYYRIKTWFLIPPSIVPPPHVILVLQLSMMKHFLYTMDLFLSRLDANSGADHYDPELAFSTARDLVRHRDPFRPFFLWVHLFPPHDPYATPFPFIGRFDQRPGARTRFDSTPLSKFEVQRDRNFPDRFVGRYDESITYVDHHLGRFVDWLKEVQLFDSSLLVVTADHGESFVKNYGRHGGPMLHDALIRIPLVVKEPGQRAGRRLDVLAEQIDLMPTILDLAAVTIGGGAVEGRSLMPAMNGKKLYGPVFSMNLEQSGSRSELNPGTVGMIEGRWKYVHYWGLHQYPMLPSLEDSLHDLKADPGEDTNRVADQPAVAVRMLGRIQAQLRENGRALK